MTDHTKILYIEDNLANQKLVQRVLGKRDYHVLIANDGFEGIEMAMRELPQLILMDINLPTMDGKQITTRLRSMPHFSKTPIIALTANTSPDSRAQALAAGCNGFLTKPIDISRFPDQVNTFLEGHADTLEAGEESEQLKLYAQQLVTNLENKIRELQEANHQLRELDRMKSDFIILVSHELRTPLTLINGYSHLLQDYAKQAQKEGNDQLLYVTGGLTKGINRLSTVINEIISVSRIASGALELAIGPVLLSVLIKEILEDKKELCESRDLNISLVGLDDVPMIQGDGVQLKIALGNIIGNAIKFTPDNGIIQIVVKAMTDSVSIMIKDTGIGIPLDEQRRIFDQFHILGSIQNHSTSKSNFQGGGIGLGLPIARGVIEAHRGRIWVESKGRDEKNPPGSTFNVLLPLDTSEQDGDD
ncbi:MAG: hybrid sensor histidine kinase/response regulator [Ardenticatenaceae bacterium]|nr:hybrid sensor histidine kinase/response regulator [Ardenticatenaceae bacterium]